jgi:hypothetical protein
MLRTLVPMITLRSLVQDANSEFPIEVTPLPMVAFVRLEQQENAETPEVTAFFRAA